MSKQFGTVWDRCKPGQNETLQKKKRLFSFKNQVINSCIILKNSVPPEPVAFPSVSGWVIAMHLNCLWQQSQGYFIKVEFPLHLAFVFHVWLSHLSIPQPIRYSKKIMGCIVRYRLLSADHLCEVPLQIRPFLSPAPVAYLSAIQYSGFHLHVFYSILQK